MNCSIDFFLRLLKISLVNGTEYSSGDSCKVLRLLDGRLGLIKVEE